MTHASLFSGIGGPEVAAAALGWQNVFHCEIDDFCRQILEYWFPKSKSYKDVKETDFTEWRGTVDVLTGGFPCQPFSTAGKRRGTEDNRYLWPEFIRAIKEIKPRWVVGENVAGILTMVESSRKYGMAGQTNLFNKKNDLCNTVHIQRYTVDKICTNLACSGYEVQPVIIPACAVGAPHRRDRVFIVARRVEAVSEDTMHGGQLHRPNEEQGSERNERNTGAGGGERICSCSSRAAAADPDGARQSAPDEPSGRERATLDGERISELFDGTERPCLSRPTAEDVINAERIRRAAWADDNGFSETSQQGECGELESGRADCPQNWWRGFPYVSPVHRGNDGLPFDVDNLSISFNQWRTKSLKAYGNAIVPQVIYEIFRAIDILENNG